MSQTEEEPKGAGDPAGLLAELRRTQAIFLETQREWMKALAEWRQATATGEGSASADEQRDALMLLEAASGLQAVGAVKEAVAFAQAVLEAYGERPALFYSQRLPDTMVFGGEVVAGISEVVAGISGRRVALGARTPKAVAWLEQVHGEWIQTDRGTMKLTRIEVVGAVTVEREGEEGEGCGS